MSTPLIRLGVLFVAASLVGAVPLSGCALPGTEHSRSISKPFCTTLEAEIGEEIVAIEAKANRGWSNARDQANLNVTYAGLTSEGEILVLKRGRQGGYYPGSVDEVTEAKLQEDQWFELRADIHYASDAIVRVYVHDKSKARLTYHLERLPDPAFDFVDRVFGAYECDPFS